jgi:hypothetical protein
MRLPDDDCLTSAFAAAIGASDNLTSAFATELEASPWLRQYAADSAERAARELYGRDARAQSHAYVAPAASDNMTSAFATELAASPLLRLYVADSAKGAAASKLRNRHDRAPEWDAHLRLYPRKLTGWAKVERAAAVASAYWELWSDAAAQAEERRVKKMRHR